MGGVIGEPSLVAAWRRVAAGATAVVALLTVVSAITPNIPWRDDVLIAVEPGPLLSLEHVLTAVAGLGLLGLARSLAEGTKRAHDVTVVVLLVVAALHVSKGLDYEEATVALTLAGLLLAGRRAFTRGSTSRPRLLAGVVAVAAVAGAYLLSVVGLLIRHPPGETAGQIARAGVSVLETGGWWLTSEAPLSIGLDVAVGAGLVASAVFVHGLLRPEPSSDGHSRSEHERAAALIDQHGSDSLDPFMLREDKAFFFAHGGVLAYRVLRDTAVVSGDPVGPPGAAPGVLADFLALAHRRGWRVAMTGVSERHVGAYRGLGMRALRVGEEAIVDPGGFSLAGRRIRKVRQSVARVERRGWTIAVAASASIGPEDWRVIAELEESWRACQRRVYGFAMTLGRMGGAPEDEQMLYVLGRDPDGRVQALLRFVPYGAGLSLDAMRRAGDVPNGLTEALVVRALEHARREGASEVSLNFAGFGHIMAAGRELSGPQRAARVALGLAHNRFQLERLSAFNQKFEPAWRPRYLVYGSRSQFPRAALRVLQAEAYLRPPRSRPRHERWMPPTWHPPGSPPMAAGSG